MTTNNTNLTSSPVSSVELSFDWEYDGMERVSWTSHTTSIEGRRTVFVLIFDHSNQMFSVSASCWGILIEQDHQNLAVGIGKATTQMVHAIDLKETLEEFETDQECEARLEYEALDGEYGGYNQPSLHDGSNPVDYTHDDDWDRDYPTDSIPF